jgi:hypothetical protein
MSSPLRRFLLSLNQTRIISILVDLLFLNISFLFFGSFSALEEREVVMHGQRRLRSSAWAGWQNGVPGLGGLFLALCISRGDTFGTQFR